MLHVENATKHSFLASPQKQWIGGCKQRANCDILGEQDIYIFFWMLLYGGCSAGVWDCDLKVSFSWGIFELFS